MRRTVLNMGRRREFPSCSAPWTPSSNIGYLLTDPDCTITTGHKEERKQNVKREVCINDMLPDELLFLILSHLRPLDLVRVVPVVCQRWNMLARSKAAWRSAELIYCHPAAAPSGASLHHESFLQVARRAPFLDVLDISNVVNHLGGKKVQQVFSTLLKTKCEVRCLVLAAVRHRALMLLLKLLMKYAPTLKSLCLQLDFKLVSLKAWSMHNNREFSFLTCIRDMPQLNSLNMMNSILPPELYHDEFLQGFRALKHLQWSSDCEIVEALILDILENCRKRLTTVSWTHSSLYSDIPGALLVILSNCTNVQQLETPWRGIEVIIHMPCLEKLTLNLAKCAATDEEILHLGDLISDSEIISKVREIRLLLSHPNCLVPVSPRIISVLKAVTRRCGAKSSLRVLHLLGQFKGRVLTEMFKKMPQLEELHFTWHGGLNLAHLKLIGKMPNLKFLEIKGLPYSALPVEKEMKTVLEEMSSSHPGIIFKFSTSVAMLLNIPNALISLSEVDEVKRSFELTVNTMDEVRRSFRRSLTH